MADAFGTIGLVGKTDHPRVQGVLECLHAHLHGRGRRVVVEQACAHFLAGGAEAMTLAQMGTDCDLAIVVGGDGTFLATATALAPYGVPLIGVNLGRVGFLVDIGIEEARTKIDEVLAGRFEAEHRVQLNAALLREGRVLWERTALNEVVVHRWVSASMIELETTIDGVFLNRQRSDGLIVSTPTGSTAYALSGGGPILHPSLPAMVLVPINPYTLSNRPIVLDGDSTVEITFKGGKEINAQVTCDSYAINDVKVGDRVVIRKDAKPVTILHPLDHDFFQILRAKLNWSG